MSASKRAPAGRRVESVSRRVVSGGPRRPRTRTRLLLIALGAGAVGALGAAVWLGFQDRGGPAPIGTLQASDYHALAISPADPDTVYFGHHNGVMKSADAGRSWSALVSQRNFDAMGLAVSHGDPRQLYLAGHDLFQSSGDGGATWQPVRHNLPGTDIHGFAMSPDDPSRLFAFVVGHGLFQSADGGRGWEPLSGQLPGDVMGLAAAGGQPEMFYAASMGWGVLRSGDGGRSWAPAVNGLGPRRALAVAVDPAARQTVYAGVDGGLYKSTDGGDNWRQLPFPADNAVALAVGAASPNRLLAVAAREGQGLVYRSDDGGQSWGSP